MHREGDANIPDNYRGIALTGVWSKVYTHILNKRLARWAEQEEKNLEQKAGFIVGYSTVDHIFTLYGIWICAKIYTEKYKAVCCTCRF